MPSGELTCVDTSAWIEYLRNTSHPIVAVTRELVTAARICLADVVVGELFQGVRIPRERAILEEFADTIPVVSGTPATWKMAGQLAAEARARGKTLHLIDCYLARLALDHQVAVLTCDRHFETLQALLPHLSVQCVSATHV
jgi:predicted nucleic acid-binding protein